MQGDCLSAVLFIYYLACALAGEKSDHVQPESLDHTYAIKDKTEKETNINPKYADDITYITTSRVIHEKIEETTSKRLKEYNLQVNLDKTERFLVPEPKKVKTTPPVPKENDGSRLLWSELDWMLPPREPPDPPPAWATTKLLGSKIGTEQDIQNRKGKAISAMKDLYTIFNSKFISNTLKFRVFQTYISSIFLYNCEIWSLSETQNKLIDAFQRKQLRYAINIHYPKFITNVKLYEITGAEPWSITIKRRRLNLLGHVLRLDEETPVRQALLEAVEPYKRGRGRPPTNWLQTIQKDLADEFIRRGSVYRNSKEFLYIAHRLASDRKEWRDLTRRSMCAAST